MTTTLKTANMWAVVPVKALNSSKTRLTPVLSYVQRAEFTLLMAHDVLEQLTQVEILAGVGVLSNDELVQQLACRLNVRIWSDKADALNPGLQAVASKLAIEGSGVMVIPCDVPSARAKDYRRLLAGHREGVTLVAAGTDDGTNALLCDEGLDFSFHYGPVSFMAHKLEAEQHGISMTVAEQTRLQWDIDRPEDLRWLLASDHDCRARDYLQKLLPDSMGTDWKNTG